MAALTKVQSLQGPSPIGGSGGDPGQDYVGLGHTGKKYVFRNLILALTTQGGTTNYVSAAACGLNVIVGAFNATKSDDSVVLPCAASHDGTKLLLGGGASNAPADYTGTFYVTVYGYNN